MPHPSSFPHERRKKDTHSLMVLLERYGHKEHIYAKYEHPVSYSKKCSKVGQRSWSRSHIQNFVIIRKALSKRTQLPNMKALSLRIKKLWLMTKFLEVGKRSRSRSHVQILWCRRKGLVNRNTHAKYESHIS